MAEVPTLSTGATTAGGTVTWTKYFERDDHLGMRHVYYRQQYHDPQLGRSLRILRTTVSLHYGPDGVLRRAHLAQVSDVPPLPSVIVTTPQQAFAAAQLGLAAWPGFNAGNPNLWPPGTLAAILDDAELTIVAPEGASTFGLQWRLSSLNADLVPHFALVDAATGLLLGVTPANAGMCPPPPVGCAHCSPGDDGWPTEWPDPSAVPAKAWPENRDLIPCGDSGYGCGQDGYRDVKANQCTFPYENEVKCEGAPCTYEAVWAAQSGVPQIEVYHGMPSSAACWHCGWPYHEGKYMRVGLMEVPPLGTPTYDLYAEPETKKAVCTFSPHYKYRIFAGDAMYYTFKTMEVLRDYFGRCGFDDECETPKPARIVVDAGTLAAVPGPDDDCTDDGAFFAYGEFALHAPQDGVAICHPNPGVRSKSAAQDVVAHEWGHAVSKYSPANFPRMCLEGGGWFEVPEPCELCEGFADVVGHIVERLTQPNPDNGSWLPERWDWIAGEDWAETDYREYLRRADQYDADPDHDCPGARWSVHANDEGCEGSGKAEHANGNRLSVVLRLMAEGGHNPAYYEDPPPPFSCTGCDIDVTPLDPVPLMSFEMAAEILFRVLDTESDEYTDHWDELPILARNTVQDIYWWDQSACMQAQATTIDAFRAVGYPQSGSPPCIACFPFQQDPCCPPDYPCLGEPE